MTLAKNRYSATDQLNFVVVMTDDQGWWSMPHRMPELHMPRLEAFMDGALELTQFYCASPVCSPARASILTGRSPSAHGVHDWIIGDRAPGAWRDSFLAGQTTTPELLAANGYQCWMSGKWHLGDASQPAPGFRRWFAHRYGGGPYVGAPVWKDGLSVNEERYITNAITEEAVRFITERDRTSPFYLQVNYTAPHDPWLQGHPEKYTSLYESCDFPSVPRIPRHEWADSRAGFDSAYADPWPRLVGYCASLSAVDDGFGEILDVLDREGLTENTVVLFLSDNGFSCGHHGLWGKGNGTWPLNLWDMSVRVPLVARIPGGARGTNDLPVSATSLHATICDLASVELPPDLYRAEESVAPLLKGSAYQGRGEVVVSSEYGLSRMITDGRWVFIYRKYGPNELYDRESDPEQWTNLIDDPVHAGHQESLHGRLRKWYATREREGASAWDHNVRGYGQIHPLSRGLPDHQTYATAPGPDGT